jgi:hypothetical protein
MGKGLSLYKAIPQSKEPLVRLILLVYACLIPTAFAVDFAHDVLPILRKHCAECHTGDKKKGGLAMNTRAELLAGSENGAVVTPGNATKSLFIELIRSADDEEWMPPKGPRLPAAQIATLTQWINEGMAWEPKLTLVKPSWEPPLKPRTVALPPPTNGREHPIDRLLDAGLAKDKQPTPSPISDAAFLRRASLDIVGLLPTPEQLKAFLADSAATKREALIDSLLADEVAYADHWLTTWNDLLRNDYTGTGFITGGRKQITTWLYASLRENKPYDQLVRELIAPGQESAGFIDGIKWRGEVNASQTRDIQFSQNISQVFLGINMKCASCHNSFTDRWTLSEAYNLAAIYADKPVELNRCDKPTGEMATPKWIFPEIGDVDPKAPKAKRLEQLAGLMTHPENGRFSRTVVNRIWAQLMGRGIVHPVDAMDTQPWNEDLLDFLAVQFAEDGYDLRAFIGFIMRSQAYQSKTVVLAAEPGEDYVYAGPIAKRMTAEQLIDSIWQITGRNPTKAEAKVDRSLKAKASTEQPEAPAADTAVSASWIWSAAGEKADLRHRFTLDTVPAAAWLRATCDNAFSMRINGKLVASSREWQKPVHVDVAAALQAGENLVEVEAEMWGGSSGLIAEIAGIFATDATWEARPPKGEWAPAIVSHPHGQGPWGAILLQAKPMESVASREPPVRAALVKNDFLMRSLGRPHRDQVVTSRPRELTTLQAIDLANGDILADYLGAGAKHLAGENKKGDALIDWLYEFALSRGPTPGERGVLAEIARVGDARAVEDLLWSVLMQPEFQIVR